jgi:hypothetical protein
MGSRTQSTPSNRSFGSPELNRNRQERVFWAEVFQRVDREMNAERPA